MKIIESAVIAPYTSLVFEAPLPLTNWRGIDVEGVRYETLPVMDAGNNVLAIHGAHDLTGKEAEFTTYSVAE